MSVSRRRFLQVSGAGTAAVALGDLPSPAPAYAGQAARPSGLLTALLPGGLGIETAKPRLSWQVADLGDGTAQTHYQLQLATTPRPGRGRLVWDSGKVASAGSVAVPYGGPALDSAHAYWWRVRTFAGRRGSDWSEPALLATGPGGTWSASPIWAAPQASPADGTYTVALTITAAGAGLLFRASSTSNAYMWELVAGSPGTLKKHTLVNGTYTVLGSTTLPMAVTTGTAYPVSITMAGSAFTTSINGTVVDTTTDTTFASGSVGLRNGRSEAQTYDRVTFTDAAGTVLLDDDFSTSENTFGAGTVSGGTLTFGNSAIGVASALLADADWALLRTEFTPRHTEIAAAILHVAASSPVAARQYVAKVWANGRLAGFASVRPASSTETRYHSYDVTGLLRPGRANALAALCYAASGRQFLAQLVITYADGRTETIGSGTAWKARREAGLLRDHGYTGGGYYYAPQEYWDLRHEPRGWTAPGFDDSGWESAAAAAALPGLAPALTEPVRVESVRPASVTKVADGNWLVDLGQEIVGGLALHVGAATAGTTIEVRLGEELSDPATVKYVLRASPVYDEVWTLRDGEQRIEHWGYRGFRYAQLICSDPALDLSKAVIGQAHRVVWSEDDSSFTSSSAALNRVYDFCRYSIKATRGDLYQDTPTRERGPYEGDAYINQLSEYFTQRSFALARYSGHYLVGNPTWPTEYHLMSVLSAWQDYLHTGDPDQLAADYDAFAAKNLTSYLGSDGLVHKAPGSSSQWNGDLVDWPVASRDGYVFTQVNTVVNAFQYAAYAALAKVAGALGKTSDASSWQAYADTLRTAMAATLLGGDHFVDGAGTTHAAQHATAFPVALGAAPEDSLAALGKTLAAGGMRTSVYGAQFLLDALFLSGQADAAIGLMTATGTNSWLHMLDDLGATIVTEAWDPSLKSNMTFSHAWASAPANVIPRRVLGVEVTAPGAASVEVRPRPGSLTHVAGRVPTIRGPVGVSLDRTRGYRLDVDVPPNMTARLVLEIGSADPAAYRVTGPRTTGTDLTGNLLIIGPVGSGRTTVTTR